MAGGGSEIWPRLRATLKRFADAGGSPQEAIDTLERIGISFSGLSTVEISPESAIAALESTATLTTACARCLHYDNNPHLSCAVHPLGRPGAECGDWEDGATEAERMQGREMVVIGFDEAETIQTVVDETWQNVRLRSGGFRDVLIERRTRRYDVNGMMIDEEVVTNSPEPGEPIGH